MSAQKIKDKYNIVVLGGGPAGLSAAISILKKMNLSVLVLESQPQGAERIGESCPPDIILPLSQLGVKNAFYEGNHVRCPGYASVWGRADVGYNDFIVNPLGPSWCLNRNQFDNMLAEESINLGAHILWNTRFLDTETETENQADHQLRLLDTKSKSEFSIKADFVIDATGSSARFARTLGIQKKIDDQLIAVVRFANVTAGKISKRVHLEATPYGWWYSALLPDDRTVSMVVVEKEIVPLLQTNDHLGFYNALKATRFVGPALSKLTLKNELLLSWPINSGILPQIEGDNWVAIGDAASSYDPISSQGIYKGVTDGIHVVNKLVQFFEKGEVDNNSFTAHVESRFATYLEQRSHSYQLEQRWANESFWTKRFGVSVTAI